MKTSGHNAQMIKVSKSYGFRKSVIFSCNSILQWDFNDLASITAWAQITLAILLLCHAPTNKVGVFPSFQFLVFEEPDGILVYSLCTYTIGF